MKSIWQQTINSYYVKKRVWQRTTLAAQCDLWTHNFKSRVHCLCSVGETQPESKESETKIYIPKIIFACNYFEEKKKTQNIYLARVNTCFLLHSKISSIHKIDSQRNVEMINSKLVSWQESTSIWLLSILYKVGRKGGEPDGSHRKSNLCHTSWDNR